MSKSPFREEDVSDGQTLIERGDVRNVLFSGPTYQVEIHDDTADEPYWIFLQLKTGGAAGDFFCSCSDFEEHTSCRHVAAAYIQVFHGHKKPLHIRFEGSLWNRLCQIAAHRHGYEEKCVEKGETPPWTAGSQSGKVLFAIEPKSDEGETVLDEIIFNRTEETEETSIKFSHLSSEELQMWRKGRPSHALRYELSFWSDLAKWLMWLNESGEGVKLDFKGEKGSLPTEISIDFTEVSLRFFIAKANWSSLLYSLIDLPSPIPVHQFQEIRIEKITYDEKVPLMKIHSEAMDKGSSTDEIELDDWIYRPESGFFKKDVDPLLQMEEIDQCRIEEILRSYPDLLEKYLEGTSLHRERQKASYQLYFDTADRMHISCYVFEPGDLLLEDSNLYGDWCYIAGKGFYRLEGLLFDVVKKVIDRDAISEFINHHKVWLNQYEGFQTHLTSIESQMGYQIHSDGSLEFTAEEGLATEGGGSLRDFGDWVYIEHQGFYSKSSSQSAKVIKAGVVVEKGDLTTFIEAHKIDLEQVKGFFSGVHIIKESGVNISVTPSGKIRVDPVYTFHREYLDKNPICYGGYFYVEGEGFCEIPPNMRLPKGYTESVEVSKADESYFVNFELDKLQPFIMDIDPHLVRPDKIGLQVSQISQDPVTGNWLVSLSYKSEVGTFPAPLVWRGIHDKKNYLMTKAGLLFVKQPRFDWLANLERESLSASGQQLQLTTIELLRLKAFEDIQIARGCDPATIKILEELEGNTDFEVQPMPALKGFKSDLRPYQEIGVKWLYFLYQYGMSGILCDEMGLGKTHQAMGLICAIHCTDEGKRKKFLVVCPTSVIYHWEELLKKFLPNMKVLTFYGAGRSLSRFRKSYHLLLTSYGTLRSEKDAFAKLNFEVAIFDEMQVAKNRSSQVHKALTEVNAKMKMGLTGTPIENYLRELKALFDIILPKYFPSDTAFRELFVTPIEKHLDNSKQALLAKLIRPFILRRKKTEVLDDLPEKIEELALCDLSDQQLEMYRTAYSREKAEIDKISDHDSADFYIHVFALLNALKQICNHPALYAKDVKNWQNYHSGKWDLFVELLDEARESGQKVVVFSQYLGMLDIIEDHLKSQNIEFAGIRGSTKDRREQVHRFRDDPKCEVFVASLQAAGVGIDLVSASVVIHYDRWWNPAKEDQATDRVHRIGQNRGVQVFKCVSKNSVEEHIDQLILRKRALVSSIIGYDDQDELKALSRDELIVLLKHIHTDLS